MTTHRSHRPRRRLGGVALALASVSLAGCDLPPNPGRPRLLTFGALEALADSSPAGATFANDAGVPGGLPLSDYVTKDSEDSYHLTLRDTWTEGYRSAYVTTEVWTGFDEVWVQPVYVPITGFVNGAAMPLPSAGGAGPWNAIFSVGPGSAFYSPFWQVYYFTVPNGTDPEAYRSARDVIDSHLPLVEGPGRAMSIVPGPVVLPQSDPASAQVIGGPKQVSTGYLDGGEVSYLDFGKNTFTWDDDLVVEPTPLFMLVYRDDDGNLQRLNVPTVAGTGPLYANRPADVMNNVPHYGAYWRLYTVEVPRTARIFAPSPPFATEIAAAGYPAALLASPDLYGASLATVSKDGLSFFLGRVALNASPAAGATTGCFNTYDQLDTTGGPVPGACQWLDSQPAIEQAVPASSIRRTDILLTCPFVSYHDVAFAVTP